jgi:tetratricopeptide (TPR) repeat protein
MRLSFKILTSVAIAVFVAGVVFARAALAEQPILSDNAQVDAEPIKKELEKLKDEKAYETKRVEEMRQEREQFVKEIRRVENLNTRYTKEIEDLRGQMEQQQQTFEERMKKMEDQIKESKEVSVQKAEPAVAASAKPPLEVEMKANDILMKGGDLDPEDQKFKEELARAHYNMGNVYFERGEYQRSVVEYFQAVDLMPYDADAHYNLAFVSGEYIGDQETALKHYQWYLYLRPDADDKKMIDEKIIAAKLNLRGRVSESKVDVSDITGQVNVAR